MGQEVDRYGRNDALGTKRALDPSCYVKRGQRAAYPVSLRPDGAGPAQEPLNGAAEAPYRRKKAAAAEGGTGGAACRGLSGGSAGGAAPGRNPVASAGHRRGLVRRAAAVPGENPRRGAGADHGGRPLRRGGADGDGVGSASPVSHIEGPLRRGGAVPPSAAGIRRVHRAEPGDGAGAGVCPHGL